jgi:hypothetical protein
MRGENGMHIKFCLENLKGRDRLEETDVNRKKKVKMVLRKKV